MSFHQSKVNDLTKEKHVKYELSNYRSVSNPGTS